MSFLWTFNTFSTLIYFVKCWLGIFYFYSLCNTYTLVHMPFHMNFSRYYRNITEQILRLDPYFMPLVLLYTPLKTSAIEGFSDVFRGYRKRPVSWNGLTCLLFFSFVVTCIYCHTIFVHIFLFWLFFNLRQISCQLT